MVTDSVVALTTRRLTSVLPAAAMCPAIIRSQSTNCALYCCDAPSSRFWTQIRHFRGFM